MLQFEYVIGIVKQLRHQPEPHWANAWQHISIVSYPRGSSSPAATDAKQLAQNVCPLLAQSLRSKTYCRKNDFTSSITLGRIAMVYYCMTVRTNGAKVSDGINFVVFANLGKLE